MDLFPCPNCSTNYPVKRLFLQSSKTPACHSCGADFPKTESGSCLIYERADPVNLSDGVIDDDLQPLRRAKYSVYL